MKLVFADNAWEDYLHWQQADDKVLTRLNDLIKECQRTPFKGTGKPEPLKGSLAGWWSRRIAASACIPPHQRSLQLVTDSDPAGLSCGVVQMLDDLEWLFELLGPRCQMSGHILRSGQHPATMVNPYVLSEPDGPVPARNADFTEGPSWYLDPGLGGMIEE